MSAVLIEPRRRLRGIYRRLRRGFVERFRSYGSAELRAALTHLGVRPGDTVMLHSAFEPHHGFTGSAADVIDCVLDTIGPSGHLLMVSLPYHTATIDYLAKGRTFDVRRTPSAMGLVSEYFRRRPGVLRSVHPTHPVLAFGPRASWFVAGHEHSIFPCGPDTPFARALESDGKVVFLNVPFGYLTFFHYLEHLAQRALPFSIYHDAAFRVPVIDGEGAQRVVTTLTFSREAIRRRRIDLLEKQLAGHGLLRRVRVGASSLLMVELRAITMIGERMIDEGPPFYDSSPT